MERLLWPQALLLVALLFPGLCEARHASQGGAEDTRAPRDEALRPGTNDSRGLHPPGKRYLVPLNPRWWIMEQVSKLSTAGKAKAFVRNIVIIWKYKWATALKERMPAVYLRIEAADTEARGLSTCCPPGPWQRP
ncbi:hypothetical protein QTO34_016429, partial [Cnephaeus nilssonii]